ncbi:MAG: hypothetical protein LBG06_06795 [Deltaproteobacteria bacterium]|jgi:hypothetical protein|nr:hypothetical protein [Deltaproteobacteria bacterium]
MPGTMPPGLRAGGRIAPPDAIVKLGGAPAKMGIDLDQMMDNLTGGEYTRLKAEYRAQNAVSKALDAVRAAREAEGQARKRNAVLVLRSLDMSVEEISGALGLSMTEVAGILEG